MSTVIEINNLSKAYQLGQINTGTLGSDLQRWIAIKRGKEDPFLKIGETNDRTSAGVSNVVWSLKDINFNVEKGEAVGIIGKNGAGKSTLLKILSQITGPTTGSVKVKGRVASLLEVGTGFHPELSGRENIFLNGAILGMRKKEIERKFDEIVDFSGVQRYIDTPVKRYSSGMYVRLAFAVAAYLESEILIVDEVLAVGDMEFQKKCLGKMGDISKGEGRTILFVSHNIQAIKQLCTKGVFLDNGTVKLTGKIDQVAEAYMSDSQSKSAFAPFQIREINVLVKNILINKEQEGVVTPFKPLTVEIELHAEQDIDKIGIQIMLSNDTIGGVIFASNTKTTNNLDVKLKKGKNIVTCSIDSFNMASGKYWLGFAVDLPFVVTYYHETTVLNFTVEETIIPPRLLTTSPAYGHFYFDHKWGIEYQ